MIHFHTLSPLSFISTSMPRTGFEYAAPKLGSARRRPSGHICTNAIMETSNRLDAHKCKTHKCATDTSNKQQRRYVERWKTYGTSRLQHPAGRQVTLNNHEPNVTLRSFFANKQRHNYTLDSMTGALHTLQSDLQTGPRDYDPW